MNQRPSVSHILQLLRVELLAAWRAHRRYVFLSVLLLGGSMPVGAWFWQRRRGIVDLPFSGLVPNPLAQQFPALSHLGDNTELFSLLVVGAVSVGVLTAAGLVVQGIVAGYFLALSVGEYSTGLLFLAVVPHGVLLFFSFVLASAISFRLVARTLGRLVGTQPPLDGVEWRRAGLLLVCAWLGLLASALVEAHVTFWLTDLLL